MSTLPSKRASNSPPDLESHTSPKKSKAEKKRQSISRAQVWAEERKRKKEGGDEEDVKKHKQDDEAGEEMDVLQILPSPTRSTRSRRSNRGGDDASLRSEITESSVGSRRSTRRRTMTVKASTASTTNSRSVTKKGRKSMSANVEEPVVMKEELAKEDEVEDDIIEMKASTPIKEETEDGAEVVTTEKTEEGTAFGLKIRSFVPQFVVFLYTIYLQWSIAFALVLVFFLDWFAFEFHPKGADAEYSSQRTSSALLGFWLVTIAGYFIALGSQSMVGWIIATASLTMAKFAITTDWGENYDISLPSSPVFSTSFLDVTILDALIVTGFAGWLLLYFKEPGQLEAELPVENEESGSVIQSNDIPDVQIPNNSVQLPVESKRTGPYAFIGDRVAVTKSGATYVGTVTQYSHDTRMWTVMYEAGDGLEDDELNRLEIASAFRLYSKELGDRLKAMWRANEI